MLLGLNLFVSSLELDIQKVYDKVLHHKFLYIIKQVYHARYRRLIMPVDH